MFSDQKIKVFISSKCDKAGEPPKYDPVRAELKELIESTQLATVYLFEDEGASTLSAGSHFSYAAEDSDVCIFLIDNADGIPEGVQKEINIVKKKNKKALYYFCDETTTEKTELEKSLKGAKFTKSDTVHRFSDLGKNGGSDLINDILLVYHDYCANRFVELSEDSESLTDSIDIQDAQPNHRITFPKVVLKNIDKCIKYILEFTADYHFYHVSEQNVQTSELDDWGLQFLSILFEGKSIKSFNTYMFLDTLKSMQTTEYFNVVSIRWKAIQSYFNGNIKESIENLEDALDLAKKTNQDSWVINDILIDLRNQHWLLAESTNTYSESEAQKALNENTEELYYPVLDRINESLQEKYIQGLYRKKTASPYSVELGSNLDQFGELLASAYIIALYNGSLSHIILFYDKIKDFLFYLASRYDDWEFKKNLLKFAIFKSDSKDVKAIIEAYPEILMKLSSTDADSIMDFCSVHPIEYKRQIQKLIGFGYIGYYLDDSCFSKYEHDIIDGILDWPNDDNAVFIVGQYIFNSLSGVSHRMSQDTLSKICCIFMDKHYSRWYNEMFKFMSKNINLNKMSKKSAETLITHIITVLKDEKGNTQIINPASFLSVLRLQNRSLTEELDAEISSTLPAFYNFEYKLETTDNPSKDYPVFIEMLIARVQKDNEMQGKNGKYYGHSTRDIAWITSLLQTSDFDYSADTMDRLISVTSDTLIKSKESVYTKLDAVELLCCVAIKYPQDYLRNLAVYKNIEAHEDEISVFSGSIFNSNISELALKIALKFLFSTIGSDIRADIIELLPYITNDVATTISVTHFIADYLDFSEDLMLQRETETVLLQNTFEWLLMDNTDIRWNATRILISLTKDKENVDIISRKIIALIESDNVYIKNLLLRRINESYTIPDDVKKRAFSICENDPNYVTRLICRELIQAPNNE